MPSDLSPDVAQARMDDRAMEAFDRWLDLIAPALGLTHNDEEEESR